MFFSDEMISNLITNWEMAVDGFQVILCCLILIFLVRNRSKTKSIHMKSPVYGNTREFNTEIMIQSIKQQADQIFDTILSNLNRERHNFEKLFNAAQVENRSETAKFKLAGTDYLPQSSEARFTMGQHESDTDAYQMIETLAARGIDAGTIADQLKVPLAEVELLLKIKKNALVKIDPKNLDPDTDVISI